MGSQEGLCSMELVIVCSDTQITQLFGDTCEDVFLRRKCTTLPRHFILSYCQGSHWLHTLGFRKVLQYYFDLLHNRKFPEHERTESWETSFPTHTLPYGYTTYYIMFLWAGLLILWAGSAFSWTVCVPSLGNSEYTYREDMLETTGINHKLREQKVRRKSDWNCL